MLIANADGRFDTLVKNRFGFVHPIILGEHLRIHLVGGDIIGIICKESLKVSVGDIKFALAEGIESDAIACKGVIGVLGEKLFEFLATNVSWVGHDGLGYYTVSGWVAENALRIGSTNCWKV